MKASIKDFEIMAPVGSRESLAAAYRQVRILFTSELRV